MNGGMFNQNVLDALIEPAFVINERNVILAVNNSWLAMPVHGGERLPVYPGVKLQALYLEHSSFLTGASRVLAGELPLYQEERKFEAKGVDVESQRRLHGFAK
ncbi:hypothetical protein ACQKLN_30275 [Paenibacillus glucanolyticus]|nr:hypothetical protein SAMN05518848_1186 [Paenibacillus sp. PDC88]